MEFLLFLLKLRLLRNCFLRVFPIAADVEDGHVAEILLELVEFARVLENVPEIELLVKLVRLTLLAGDEACLGLSLPPSASASCQSLLGWQEAEA